MSSPEIWALRRRWLAKLAAVLLCTVLLLAGCRVRQRTSIKPKKSNDVPPININSRGITVNWQAKNAVGITQPVLDLKARDGKLEAQNQSGLLGKADGVFYMNGKPKAHFDAPYVKANRESNRVVAFGGVTVISLDPPGAKMTARRIVWIFEKNSIIATGNVYLTWTPKGEALPVAHGGAEQMTLNTDMQKLTIP